MPNGCSQSVAHVRLVIPHTFGCKIQLNSGSICWSSSNRITHPNHTVEVQPSVELFTVCQLIVNETRAKREPVKKTHTTTTIKLKINKWKTKQSISIICCACSVFEIMKDLKVPTDAQRVKNAFERRMPNINRQYNRHQQNDKIIWKIQEQKKRIHLGSCT